MGQSLAKLVLVRLEVIISVDDGAVIASTVWACGADQDSVAREIDSERRSPRIENFAFRIQVALASDEDDDVLGILAMQRFHNLGIVARRITPDILLILLQPDEQIFHVDVELRGLGA